MLIIAHLIGKFMYITKIIYENNENDQKVLDKQYKK